MIQDWRSTMMACFIAAVCVACLFGPYMISVMLGAIAGLCYLSSGRRSPEA